MQEPLVQTRFSGYLEEPGEIFLSGTNKIHECSRPVGKNT